MIVLGSGPSGLVAAHTIEALTGSRPLIFSRGDKSALYGAQFLHEPIDGIPVDKADVRYELIGTAGGYRNKVYGRDSEVTVSPDQFGGTLPAYDIRATYDLLWERYGPDANKPQFIRWEFSHNRMQSVLNLAKAHKALVFSTIPGHLLCQPHSGHYFESREVWAIGDAPELGQWVPYRAPDNTVTCNGHAAPRWYRSSNIFGHCTVEWPMGAKPPLSGVVKFAKPVSTNCNCYPEIIRIGRYGEWRKGRLVHEVPDLVRTALKERG